MNKFEARALWHQITQMHRETGRIPTADELEELFDPAHRAVDSDPWIELADGTQYRYAATPATVPSDEVICRSLSRICRFGGHTKGFYSVAEHSVNVQRLLWDLSQRSDFEEAFLAPLGVLPMASSVVSVAATWGLYHDAHEVVTGDFMSPLKQFVGDSWWRLKAIQKAFDDAVWDAVIVPAMVRLEITSTEEQATAGRDARAIVKALDLLMLRAEAKVLMPSRGDDWDNPRHPLDDYVFGFACANISCDSPGAAAASWARVCSRVRGTPVWMPVREGHFLAPRLDEEA
jgi:hypothetical protein